MREEAVEKPSLYTGPFQIQCQTLCDGGQTWEAIGTAYTMADARFLCNALNRSWATSSVCYVFVGPSLFIKEGARDAGG